MTNLSLWVHYLGIYYYGEENHKNEIKVREVIKIGYTG
ncbi:MAG: hypothetical protein ACJAYK_002473 [Crocinitomicaceae bacterium]